MMVNIARMNRMLARRLATFFVFSAAAAAIFVFYGFDPRSSAVVEQLAGTTYQIYGSCLEIYRQNPTIGAFLIASGIGIPAGLALSMVWPRNGLAGMFESRRAPAEEPRS
jgi:hypothetical protein